MKIKLIYTTTDSNKIADKIAEMLVHDNQSPCVKIIPNIQKYVVIRYHGYISRKDIHQHLKEYDIGIICYPYVGLNNSFCASNKIYEYLIFLSCYDNMYKNYQSLYEYHSKYNRQILNIRFSNFPLWL